MPVQPQMRPMPPVGSMMPPNQPPSQQPMQQMPQGGQRLPMPYAGPQPGAPPPSPNSYPSGPPRYAPHQVRMGQPMPGTPQAQYGPPPNRPPMGPMGPGGPPSQGSLPPGMKRPMMQSPVPVMKGAVPPGMGPPNTIAPGAQSVPLHAPMAKKKKKISDKVLPQKIRDLVPESQAYMDLLAFERKLDFTIMRKRLDIQEALKKPIKQKRKLRIFISNTFFPGKSDQDGNEEPVVPSWELRVEGRLLEDKSSTDNSTSKTSKRKFSSFFKSLVIELDKDLYGPDNHLVEWHRTTSTAETDGFQVKRPGDKNVRCTILLLLDYQPLHFKLEPRLARLLGIHTNTRPVIINAFWQYVKNHHLQDTHEREFINCDKYLEQIFGCQRLKFAELPSRLTHFLLPPDPIVINHLITVEGPPDSGKKTTCYDIDVEIDDPIKYQMNNFLLSTSSQQEIQSLEQKNHETVDTINQLKINREFYLGFAADPQQFIHKWLLSQVRDLKVRICHLYFKVLTTFLQVMTDHSGNPEEERMSDYFYQPWTQEAVFRYFYSKVQQRRAELEQALGIRNS